jgi:nucleotide-binding universal stress UspA family protein
MSSRLDNTADNMADSEIRAVHYDIRRILLATDGSATAVEATSVAVGMAVRFGAELVACYVDPSRLLEPLEEDMIERTEGVRHSIAGLKVAVRTAEASGVPVRSVVAEGAVATAVLETVETETCDMIVLGNTGRTGMQRLVLGSVAEAVVRQARVPVLVVKQCSTPFGMPMRADA